MHSLTVKRIALTGLALAAFSSGSALAENTLAFNAGAVSEYRYRGISQSDLKPALQGGADYTHSSGFYAGAWASGIKWLPQSNVEVDLYGGYKGEITKGLGYDVGVLRYLYPDSAFANTTEVYGALSYSVFTAKYSHSTTNLFGAADSKGSGYLDLSATVDLGSGLSLVPHVGRQLIKNNGALSYTDYALALNKDFGQGILGTVSMIGTNADKDLYRSLDGTKSTASTRLVVGVKYTF